MKSRRHSRHEPWRIGVLFSQTNTTSEVERTQLCGTLLALDEINAAGGVNGREIVPVIYEPGSSSASYVYLAKRLILEEGVTSIFGCYTSASRKAILPMLERFNGLLWYPTPYEGFEESPNMIYTGAAPNQTITQLCSYLLHTYGTRFFLIGSDYVYPRRTNLFMKEYLQSHGGEVVGERYLDIQAPRLAYLPILRAAKEVGVDVIFSTVVGDGTSHLYQTYADLGLDPTRTPIASLTTTEAEIHAMGCEVAAAHITSACYFESLGNEANAAFVSRFKKRFGDHVTPNVCAETAYFQIFLFAQALAQADSMDTDELRPHVLGSCCEAPQGRVSISASGHADLLPRIGRANHAGGFDIMVDSDAPVAADPFFICGPVTG
ncbi:transporter substrate-binding domain-containing protein [Methylopila sp. 73B]|uniref:transporter substrate-binding domain-containing protein n=1 Tax=Methylopila sp. 73B TaxID=1120792 RepID=UPI0003641128|nr:transporter substrate-binding domain-containing protein [Methylopila sp. 73B]